MTTIHVSKNDPSAFSTLQEAILSIDDRHDETIRIEVAPGIYEEKLFIRKEDVYKRQILLMTVPVLHLTPSAPSLLP